MLRQRLAPYMRQFAPLRPLVVLWLLWVLIMVGYQGWVAARFEPQRPDTALVWTGERPAVEAVPTSLRVLMLQHVRWDAGFYITIARGGYDSPDTRAIAPVQTDGVAPETGILRDNPGWIALNYAWMPFYPLLIRLLLLPIAGFGVAGTELVVVAGFVLSLLGTLAAMVALYDLARDELGKRGGLRAGFYLLIWPGGMFLAQVYSEGVFLAISFGSLALARRGRLVLAALLAACAVITRPPGLLLLLPLAYYWWQHNYRNRQSQWLTPVFAARSMFLLTPIAAWLVWNMTLGERFFFIQRFYYSRQLMSLDTLWTSISVNWSWVNNNPQAQAYFAVELATLVFGLLASLVALITWRKDRVIALYGLAVILFSLTSGLLQGEQRYVMAAPAIFLVAARWGEREVFDRVWTIAGVLVMGMMATTFTWGFWSG